MNGDEIFALVVLILLALAGGFGIFIKVKDWLSRDESSEEFLRLYYENEELEVKIKNEILRRKWARLTARHPRCPLRKFHGSDSNAGTCTDDKAPEAPPAPDP